MGDLPELRRSDRRITLEERGHKATRSGFGAFMSDLRDVAGRYNKRTSRPHKQLVLLIILGGALLRGWMLMLPITYEEARAFDLFTGRDLGTIITDHTDPLNHVFHTLLSKWSMDLFGVSTIALRLPAFLAGVLVLPMFYLFVRAMFNRYIAMLGLAMAAACMPLIEQGALAHGHSLTWLFMMMAFLLGRHFVRENNLVSAILIGIVLALGMWTMTAMIYIAIAIYAWKLISILMRYAGTVRKRINLWLLSGVVCGVVAFALYLPVILQHGVGQLWDHPSLPENSWRKFSRQHQEGAFELWIAVADTTGTVIAVLGIVSVLVSAYISAKFRVIMFSLLIGAVPLVLLKARVAPPPVWYYTLFFFVLGSAIAIFYLLKFLQEKIFTSLGKRTRTSIASLVLFTLLTIIGSKVVIERMERFPEAEGVAAVLREVIGQGDKVYVDFPWDAPVRFHARAKGIERADFQGSPATGAMAYVLVAPADGQSLEQVLKDHQQPLDRFNTFKMVDDRPGIEIFAARSHGKHR